jgi:hypothetical protein
MDAIQLLLRTPEDLAPLRIRPERLMTDDEYFEFCAANDGLRIERTSDGEIIVMAPTGGKQDTATLTFPRNCTTGPNRTGAGKHSTRIQSSSFLTALHSRQMLPGSRTLVCKHLAARKSANSSRSVPTSLLN